MPSGKNTGDDRLNWRYQDKSYNELFKKWRRQQRDSIGFYYVENPNELTYRDGYGFVNDYPEIAERNALRRVMNIVGVTMILLGAIDIFWEYFMPPLLSMLGVKIYRDPYTGVIYGSEWMIFAVSAFFEVIKRAAAFLYVCCKIKMPVKLMIPTKITNKTLFKYSVPVMLGTAGVCVSFSWVIGMLLAHIHIGRVQFFEIPENKAVFAAYIIVYIVIVPIISEIHTRGALLQLLRQFGDGFAIIVTAALTAVITYDARLVGFAFLTSVVIGYFTARTGSVVTAVVMRSAANAVLYGFYLIGSLVPPQYVNIVLITVWTVILGVGLVFFIRLFIKHSDKFEFKFRIRYLNFSEKCVVMLLSTPTLIGFTVLLIHSIVNVRIV